MVSHWKMTVLFTMSAIVLIAIGWLTILCLELDSGQAAATGNYLEENLTPVQVFPADSDPEFAAAPAVTRESRTKNKLTPAGDFLKITGRVLSYLDRVAIKEARVRATLLHGDTPAEECTEGATDPQGVFLLLAPPQIDQAESSVHLAITAPGFQHLLTTYPLADVAQRLDCGDLLLSSNGCTEHTIQVIDLDGKPIPGALVRIYKDRYNAPVVQAETDGEGWVRCIDPEILFAERDSHRHYALHVTKEGYADTYYHAGFLYRGDTLLPRKVTMEPANTWVSQVLDAATGQGIAGAKVVITTIPISFHQEEGHLCAFADETGCFVLPRCRFEGEWSRGKPDFHLFASAAGYRRTWISKRSYPKLFTTHEIYPSHIELRCNDALISCIAVEDETGVVLPGIILENKWSGKIRTDAEGRFDLPVPFEIRKSRNHIVVIAPELKMAHDGWLEAKSFEQTEWRMPFKKLLCDGARVRVKNELGQPVFGANVKFIRWYGKSSMQGDVLTDRNGECEISFPVTDPMQSLIRVDHPDYLLARIQDHSLGAAPTVDGKEFFEFVLSSGTLYQRLKVVDENGAPVARMPIEAELLLPDGVCFQNVWVSDEQGGCAMRFPRFQDGILRIYNRPDTDMGITYEQLFDQNEILLVFREELDPAYAVEGRIQDAQGNGLQGVRILYSEMKPIPDRENGTETNEDGVFQFLAAAERIYQIKIQLHWDGKSWYTAEPVEGLTRGSRLNVTMESWHGVRVRLSLIRKMEGSYSDDYRAYLEDESGTEIEVQKTVKDSSWVVFLSPASGKFRAVIETQEGIYRTPFFTVKEGESIRTELHAP